MTNKVKTNVNEVLAQELHKQQTQMKKVYERYKNNI